MKIQGNASVTLSGSVDVDIEDVKHVYVESMQTDEEDEPYPNHWRDIVIDTVSGTIRITLDGIDRSSVVVYMAPEDQAAPQE